MKTHVFHGFVALVTLLGCGEDEPSDGGLTSGFDAGLGDAAVLPDSSLGDGSILDGAVMETSVGEDGSLDAGDSGAPDATSDSAVEDSGVQPDELECSTPVTSITECPVCAADATCDAPTYTDPGDGTVTSSCCGLVWQKAADGVLRDFSTAHAYCESLSLAGGGWRLPSITELQTLVEGTTPPTIDQAFFPGTADDVFWTSTAYEFSGRAWMVVFYDGSSGGSPLATPNHVRCVR